MSKLKVGVVGCGDVAFGVYLPGLKEISQEGGLELVAVCDSLPERAKRASEVFGVQKVYTDYDKMLKDEDIEIVVNLTPVLNHADVSLRAISAGKHVYSEKPIAATLEEADKIIDSSKKKGVKLACAPATLLHPDNLKVLSLLNNNIIGKIAFVRARASNPGPAWITDFTTDPTWFYKQGAGPVFDLAVYPLQLITRFLGPAKRVFAFSGKSFPRREVKFGEAKGKMIKIEVDDNTQIMLDFGDSTFAILDATFCVMSAKGPRMEIYGNLGTINLYSKPEEPSVEIFQVRDELGFRGWSLLEPVYRGSLSPASPPPASRGWTFADGVLHFAKCIEEGKDPLISGEHARHVLEIMIKAYDSAKLDKPLNLVTTF